MNRPQVARILDANFNRAREALRVVEEFGRFILNDSTITATVKNIRHRLADSQKLLGEELLPFRATDSDVGRNITTPSEFRRPHVRSVLIANCRRATEAFRTLEEYGKTLDEKFARTVERIRYDFYQLEQDMMARADRASRFGDVRLYVLISESVCRADWKTTARAALDGGAKCLQLREKSISDDEWLRRAEFLSELCRKFDAVSIINDRPDIAAAAEADGVHLGQNDLPPHAARKILPNGKIIGVSTHHVDQAKEAEFAGADYVAIGPMFPSATKPRDFVAGTDILRAVAQNVQLPVVAIGGITFDTAVQVLRAGADTLCICAAICQAENVEAATRKFVDLIDDESKKRPVPSTTSSDPG